MSTTNHSVLKIYASSTDKIGFELLYEKIVIMAKHQGLAGVTVYRGIMGFGMSNNQISSSRFWELTEKLPVVIEIIDKTSTIEKFYNFIEKDLVAQYKGCLVTIHPVEVRLQKVGKK